MTANVKKFGTSTLGRWSGLDRSLEACRHLQYAGYQRDFQGPGDSRGKWLRTMEAHLCSDKGWVWHESYKESMVSFGQGNVMPKSRSES